MAVVDAAVGSVALLGIVHGAEPGHGWPVAAAYALDRPNKWLAGLAAGTLLGLGHLVSSLAVVAAYFLLQTVTAVTAPWVRYVAGGLLIALGVRELLHGRSHHRGEDLHEHAPDGVHSVGRTRSTIDDIDGADRGLVGIAGFAFTLGFVHEEEFQIVAICAGSERCLALMLVYAAAVLAGIVGLTLALVGGYYRFEDRVDRLAPYLPYVSGVVLVGMGLGFVLGVL